MARHNKTQLVQRQTLLRHSANVLVGRDGLLPTLCCLTNKRLKIGQICDLLVVWEKQNHLHHFKDIDLSKHNCQLVFFGGDAKGYNKAKKLVLFSRYYTPLCFLTPRSEQIGSFMRFRHDIFVLELTSDWLPQNHKPLLCRIFWPGDT